MPFANTTREIKVTMYSNGRATETEPKVTAVLTIYWRGRTRIPIAVSCVTLYDLEYYGCFQAWRSNPRNMTERQQHMFYAKTSAQLLPKTFVLYYYQRTTQGSIIIPNV
jgi:hypothetical protein